MGWRCATCGESDPSDNLDFPIMHGVSNPGHKVEPDLGTVLAWGRVL